MTTRLPMTSPGLHPGFPPERPRLSLRPAPFSAPSAAAPTTAHRGGGSRGRGRGRERGRHFGGGGSGAGAILSRAAEGEAAAAAAGAGGAQRQPRPRAGPTPAPHSPARPPEPPETWRPCASVSERPSCAGVESRGAILRARGVPSGSPHGPGGPLRVGAFPPDRPPEPGPRGWSCFYFFPSGKKTL